MPRQSDRSGSLRRLFDEGHQLSLGELSDRLHVSRRQVRRLIGRLRQDGVPVSHRRDGRMKRFFVPEEHRAVLTEAFEFDEEEVLTLAFAAEAAKATLRDTPMGPPLESAFESRLDGLEVEGKKHSVRVRL